MNEDLKSDFTQVAKTREVSQWTQYWLLVDRSWTHVLRNPISINFLIILAFYNSFLWGSIFYKVDGETFGVRKDNQEIAGNLMGLTFLTTQDMFVNMCFGQVMALPQSYPVYKREIANNMYSITASYYSRVTVATMTFFFYPFLLTTCSIWFYDLQMMGIKGFCQWWGILTITAFVGSSFGMTMGCLFPVGNTAQMTA